MMTNTCQDIVESILYDIKHWLSYVASSNKGQKKTLFFLI
jgi:hypothetical protein